jgi:NAD(P)-dependent dehydrogenase (short-subunit alcohol dehydrogenase family)
MPITVDLRDRVALVTGGTKGIGAGIADRLAEAGATVVVCGRSTPADLRGHQFHACDVRDPDAVAALVDAVVADHGRLDVAVNNAGGSPSADAADASPRFSEAIIRLNLLAPLHVAQAANRVMQAQAGGGSIVNITSVSGLRPSPGTAAYGAAKAGLLSLTQTLAVEWAPTVRVNAVSAGLVATDDSLDHYGGAEGIARVAATVPAGRFGTPADVADAVVFLVSPLADYVTGANLVLHGGGEWPAFLRAAASDSGEVVGEERL